MPFKFEQLEVWQRAIGYVNLIYALSSKLPDDERYNLKSQITRAAVSIALNIAEGSTGQSDAEKSRFLSMAVRSPVKTVACQRLFSHRKYVLNEALLEQADLQAQELTKRLHAFRKALSSSNKPIKEEQGFYVLDEI
jgi:four helix bundle protein